MEYTMPHLMIEAAVGRGLREIRKGSKRELRNLVDLGLRYAKGAFQDDYFKLAQHMLEDQNSPYYDLVFRIARQVDESLLKTFGMNLGYHSWTVGARKIREYEKTHGFNVPWTLVFDLRGEAKAPLTREEIAGLIRQGEQMGIFCVTVFARGQDVEWLQELFQQFQNHAFLVFITPEMVQDRLIQGLCSSKNTLPFVMDKAGCWEAALAAADKLEQAQCLFGAAMVYDDNTLLEIQTERLSDSPLGRFPLVMLIEGEACSDQGARTMYERICQARMQPTLPVFLMDFYPDLAHIDRVISTENCYLKILRDGSVSADSKRCVPNESVRGGSLEELMRRCMPPVGYLSGLNRK